MKNWNFPAATLATAAALLMQPACEKTAPAPAAGGSAPPVIVRPAVVSLRADGLAYATRSPEPFTGDFMTNYLNDPSKPKRKEGYTRGIRDGETIDYYPDGSTKQVQRFRMGQPVSSTSWYENGQRETEVSVGSKEGAPGTYQKWNDQGVVEVEAGVDEEVHWHGDYQAWTPDGRVEAHYRYQHGVLRVILAESPAAQEKRLAAHILPVPREEPVAPKAVVVAEPVPSVPPSKPPLPYHGTATRPAGSSKPDPARKPAPSVKPRVPSKPAAGPVAASPPRPRGLRHP